MRSLLVVVTTLCAAASSALPYGGGADKLPNFVIMLMDDMGWGDLGCFGEPSKETPNLDRMAREGQIVTEMYAANPLCSPSRASLLTGRLPIRNGFYTTNIPGRNSYTPQEIVGGIPDYEQLLSELLKQKNYTTGIIGKWHLGHQDQYLPTKHGFDHQFGSMNCHFGPYDDKSKPNIPVFRQDKMIGRYYDDISIKNHVSNFTQMLISDAVDFLQQRAGEDDPFFMYWTPDSTHDPTYESQDFYGKSRRKSYGAAVQELDYGVGVILDELTRLGLDNNTFVIFTSDNGAALVSKFEGGSNGPLLCGKQTTFDGGMRVPGIFWWPGTIAPGSITHQVWTHMDFLPTFLELAGIDLPSDRVYDGLPLSNTLVNPDMAMLRSVFFYRGDRLMAVRKGPYKMHLWTWDTTDEELAEDIDYCRGQRQPNITTGVPYDHSAQPVLYNIAADPSERYQINPSSSEYQSAVDQLMEEVKEHEDNLVPGDPQLNYCDKAVMHWAPPGCEEVGECLEVPESDPYLCDWPH